MGEAKRRKAKDKDYGKRKNRFSIGVSEVTGNFLVLVDERYLYDSASKRTDAERIVKDLIAFEKDNPLPYRLTESEFFYWTYKTVGTIEPAEAVAINAVTGERTIITGEEDPQTLLAPITRVVRTN